MTPGLSERGGASRPPICLTQNKSGTREQRREVGLCLAPSSVPGLLCPSPHPVASPSLEPWCRPSQDCLSSIGHWPNSKGWLQTWPSTASRFLAKKKRGPWARSQEQTTVIGEEEAASPAMWTLPCARSQSDPLCSAGAQRCWGSRQDRRTSHFTEGSLAPGMWQAWPEMT